MTLDIIPSVPDHLPDMAAIMQTAMGRKFSVAKMRRKYLVGGDAGQGFGFLLMDQGKPVGVAGAVPYRFVGPDGKAIVSANFGDFGLFPEYRGTGAFHRLLQKLHDESRNRGAAIVIALCSEGSLAAMQRALGYETTHDLISFEMTLSEREDMFSRIQDRVRRELGWRGYSTQTPPAPKEAAGQYRAERGAAFVRTRLAGGARLLHIGGHPVMVRPGASTSVALSETLHPDEAAPLIAAVARHARRAGARSLRFMLSPNDPIFSEVNRLLGPSPGLFRICAHSWDPHIKVKDISVGFADYENF